MNMKRDKDKGRLRIEGAILIFFIFVFAIQFGYHEILHQHHHHGFDISHHHDHDCQGNDPHQDDANDEPHTDCPVYLILQTGKTTVQVDLPVLFVSWVTLFDCPQTTEQTKSAERINPYLIRGPPYLNNTPFSA